MPEQNFLSNSAATQVEYTVKNVKDFFGHVVEKINGQKLNTIVDADAVLEQVLISVCEGNALDISNEHLRAVHAAMHAIDRKLSEQNLKQHFNYQFVSYPNKSKPEQVTEFEETRKPVIDALKQENKWSEIEKWRIDSQSLFYKKRALAKDALEAALKEDRHFLEKFNKKLSIDAEKHYVRTHPGQAFEKISDKALQAIKDHIITEMLDLMATMNQLKKVTRMNQTIENPLYNSAFPKSHTTWYYPNELFQTMNFMLTTGAEVVGLDRESISHKRYVCAQVSELQKNAANQLGERKDQKQLVKAKTIPGASIKSSKAKTIDPKPEEKEREFNTTFILALLAAGKTPKEAYNTARGIILGGQEFDTSSLSDATDVISDDEDQRSDSSNKSSRSTSRASSSTQPMASSVPATLPSVEESLLKQMAGSPISRSKSSSAIGSVTNVTFLKSPNNSLTHSSERTATATDESAENPQPRRPASFGQNDQKRVTFS